MFVHGLLADNHHERHVMASGANARRRVWRVGERLRGEVQYGLRERTQRERRSIRNGHQLAQLLARDVVGRVPRVETSRRRGLGLPRDERPGMSWSCASELKEVHGSGRTLVTESDIR